MPFCMLDPGHGGHDSGGYGNGLREKDLVLDIALKTAPLLEKSGVKTILTRNNDVFIPIDGRYNMANRLGVDCFVSIHTNAAWQKSASGFEILWYSERTRDTLGACTKDELLKVRNDWRRWVYGDYASVLTKTRMPAILTESLFVTNDEDAFLLKQGVFRTELAKAHAKGICKYFKIPYKEDEPMPEPDVAVIWATVNSPNENLQVAYIVIDAKNVSEFLLKRIEYPWKNKGVAPSTWLSINSETNWGANAATKQVDDKGATIAVVDRGAKLQRVTVALYAYYG